MKKILSAAAALVAASALTVSAFAADTGVEISVTISDGTGAIPVPNMTMIVPDVDGDGAETINDALLYVHEQYGGDKEFVTEESDYGPMITTLWGVTNGGSYGYYLNNTMAYSLADPIKDGDKLYAFVYSDAENYSDVYSYFDTDQISIAGTADNEEPVQLGLQYVGWDADFNPVVLPVEGAVITIDGERTDFVTDADGKAEIDVTAIENGDHIISAVSDTQNLVPPVAALELDLEEAAAEPEPGIAESDAQPAAGDVAAATDSSKGSPNTGAEDVAAFAGIAILAVGGAFIAAKKRK